MQVQITLLVNMQVQIVARKHAGTNLMARQHAGTLAGVENLTSVVRVTGVSRHDVVSIKGPP